MTHIDYAPTLLDLAGVDHADLDGRSLVPLLEGDEPAWRDDFLIEYRGTYNALYTLHTLADVKGVTDQGESLLAPPTYRALRTETHLYVEWYGGDEHDYELYDLAADPDQLDNLLATEAGRTRHEDLVAELQERLEELTDCAGASCRS